MHSLHCARNIALCPQCEEPIPRAEMEDHVKSTHGRVECQQCNAQIEACKLSEHTASIYSEDIKMYLLDFDD